MQGFGFYETSCATSTSIKAIAKEAIVLIVARLAAAAATVFVLNKINKWAQTDQGTKALGKIKFPGTLILALCMNMLALTAPIAHANTGCPNTVEEASAYFSTDITHWKSEGAFTVAYQGPKITFQIPPDAVVTSNRFNGHPKTMVFGTWLQSDEFSINCPTLPEEETYRTYNPPGFCPNTTNQASLHLGGFSGWRDDYNHPEDGRTTLNFQASWGIKFIVPGGGLAAKPNDPRIWLPGYEFEIKPGESAFFSCFIR